MTLESSTPFIVIACRGLSVSSGSSPLVKRLIMDWVNCVMSADAVIDRTLVERMGDAGAAGAVTVAVTVKIFGLGVSTAILVSVFVIAPSVALEEVDSAMGSIDMTVAMLGASGSSVILIAMVGKMMLSEMIFGSDEVGIPASGRSKLTVDMGIISGLASASTETWA
ncbi:hypothetical protein GGI13_008708, partial [Coemansia sp. RSA 455]